MLQLMSSCFASWFAISFLSLYPINISVAPTSTTKRTNFVFSRGIFYIISTQNFWYVGCENGTRSRLTRRRRLHTLRRVALFPSHSINKFLS